MTPATLGIPALNEEAILADVLYDLEPRVQEATGPIEVLVLTAGTDRTHEIAVEHPIVDRVVRQRDPCGHPDCEGKLLCAREQIVEEAEHDVVIQADADCRYGPEWLPELLAPFDDDRVVLSYGNVLGTGLETGTRDLYAFALRGLLGHYAPGQNRAFRRSAYYDAGGYNLAAPQDAPVLTSLEEEVWFPHRMERVGIVTRQRNAVSWAGDRATRGYLLEGEKTGGAQWWMRRLRR